jgi:putative Mg2+ transporter-C (MgtC) family protein
MISNGDLIARVALGFALSFVLGFERALRGSPAGDRTFALVGVAATAITAVTFRTSPQAVAGVVTGVGFIGAGVVLRGQGSVHGLTTAATILATASIGIVVGSGYLLFGTFVGLLLLVTVEIRYVPFLAWLDARRYQGRLRGESGEGQD